jgi:uncharacterized protein
LSRPAVSVDDVARVRALLGREPRGAFEVVRRDEVGDPVVIRNAPFLDDGTPMPTRYWLVGPREVLAVSRIEAAGGVQQAEAEIDPALVAAAHARYAAERDAEVPAGAPVAPSGGVAGTRQGIKCLHAHYAWFLAGGDDPVGRWVERRLATRLDVEVAPESTSFSHAGHDLRIPIGPDVLLRTDLVDPDPPTPMGLTNAIGAVVDHVDDVLREVPAVVDASDVHVRGDELWHLAVVERGAPLAGPSVRIDRDAAEEVFRALATESRAARLHNPGLEPARVDSVLAASCVLVGLMRRLHLDAVTIEAA